jgi:pimeloyl-ACP methyl ester carboxylesterase
LEDLTIIGHSMGGLVSRSACHYAAVAGHVWPAQLQKLIFLGTPHHGTPLKRGGQQLDLLLEKSPYSPGSAGCVARASLTFGKAILSMRTGRVTIVSSRPAIGDEACRSQARSGAMRLPRPLENGRAI